MVKPEKKNAKGAPEPAAPAPESPKPEDKEAEKTAKRLYVAITSDRGNSLFVYKYNIILTSLNRYNLDAFNSVRIIKAHEIAFKETVSKM